MKIILKTLKIYKIRNTSKYKQRKQDKRLNKP